MFKVLVLAASCFVLCLAKSHEKRRFAREYLVKYQYMKDVDHSDNDLRSALRDYQTSARLPVTGTIDDVTVEKMMKPRCGVADKIEKRYSALGYTWSRNHLKYFFLNYGEDLPKETVQRVLAEAFQYWADASALSFERVDDEAAAHIKIGFGTGSHFGCPYDFDGPGGVLSHAFFPESGLLHFDDAEDFTDGTPSGVNLRRIAVHEIGHLLGLGHSSVPDAIMDPYEPEYTENIRLTDDDKAGIQSLYPCKDQYKSYCQSYKSYCSTTAWMKDYCVETCGFCTP